MSSSERASVFIMSTHNGGGDAITRLSTTPSECVTDDASKILAIFWAAPSARLVSLEKLLQLLTKAVGVDKSRSTHDTIHEPSRSSKYVQQDEPSSSESGRSDEHRSFKRHRGLDTRERGANSAMLAGIIIEDLRKFVDHADQTRWRLTLFKWSIRCLHSIISSVDEDSFHLLDIRQLEPPQRSIEIQKLISTAVSAYRHHKVVSQFLSFAQFLVQEPASTSIYSHGYDHTSHGGMTPTSSAWTECFRYLAQASCTASGSNIGNDEPKRIVSLDGACLFCAVSDTLCIFSSFVRFSTAIRVATFNFLDTVCFVWWSTTMRL